MKTQNRVSPNEAAGNEGGSAGAKPVAANGALRGIMGQWGRRESIHDRRGGHGWT